MEVSHPNFEWTTGSKSREGPLAPPSLSHSLYPSLSSATKHPYAHYIQLPDKGETGDSPTQVINAKATQLTTARHDSERFNHKDQHLDDDGGVSGTLNTQEKIPSRSHGPKTIDTLMNIASGWCKDPQPSQNYR